MRFLLAPITRMSDREFALCHVRWTKCCPTPCLSPVFRYFPGKTLDSLRWICYYRNISELYLIGTEIRHVPRKRNPFSQPGDPLAGRPARRRVAPAGVQGQEAA